MKINRKHSKFSDDKKPAWNRAKVCIGAASRFLRPYKSLRHPYPEITKIHQNLWKSLKIYKNRQKTMKVFRWQEASLESSKGFYRGSRLTLTVLYRPKHSCSEIHENQWKSMKIYENPCKSMIIDRKRWKSSDDKKPAWNRANDERDTHARKSMKIHENLWKSMKIYENPWKSIESNANR